MKRSSVIAIGSAALGVALVVGGVGAQAPPAMPQSQMQHGHGPHGATHGPHHPGPGGLTQPGQDAFAAMAEVVRVLELDPGTDWSKVDLERLRQHLIDMNEVVLHAAVAATPVPGGLTMDVTGSGRTAQSIRAMLVPHAMELDRMSAWSAKTEQLGDGVRLTVIARDPSDASTVARIRGLGFAGLLVQGGHHGPHHLAMAKGELPRAPAR
jgi:hypothetical protein